MGKIFISYRREDTGTAADRLFNDLGKALGKNQVFLDFRSLMAGSNFAVQLANTIGSCDAVLVLIGPDWKKALSERRSGEDYVLLEIQQALEAGIRTIPVLIAGARMPQENGLPDRLKPLASLQALEITQTRWDHDVKLLIAELKARWKGKTEKVAAGAGVVLGVAAANGALGVLGGLGAAASIPVVMGTAVVAIPAGAAVGGWLVFKGVKELLKKF